MKLLILAVFVAATVSVNAYNLPSFMADAPQSLKDEYESIVFKDIDPELKAQELDILMAVQDDGIKQGYADFKQQMLDIKSRFGVSVADEMKLMASNN